MHFIIIVLGYFFFLIGDTAIWTFDVIFGTNLHQSHSKTDGGFGVLLGLFLFSLIVVLPIGFGVNYLLNHVDLNVKWIE